MLFYQMKERRPVEANNALALIDLRNYIYVTGMGCDCVIISEHAVALR